MMLRNRSSIAIVSVLLGVTSCAAPSGTAGNGRERLCYGKCDEGGEGVSQLGGYDYIIVGSGAGGGPLSANLARAGKRVLLLEAGGDPAIKDEKENANYSVPAFHTRSTEDDAMRWDYYVQHFEDGDPRASQDDKAVWDSPDDSGKPRVFYPRSGALGGCTSHNALITVTPHESDWQKVHALRDREDDDSWAPANMRKYFERAERNRYVKNRSGEDGTGHGFDGWLSVERVEAGQAAFDAPFLFTALAAASNVGDNGFGNIFNLPGRLIDVMNGDINSADPGRDTRETVFGIPQAMANGKRNGTRELILETARAYPDNLTILARALVTKVIFDRSGAAPRAIGVEFIRGTNLYRAHPGAARDEGRPEVQRVELAQDENGGRRGEVILSAGAFNTPQLLMLSGVGASDQLTQHGIEQIVDLPGVGRNLQDRYEVGIVNQFDAPFAATARCTFSGDESDPCFREWQAATQTGDLRDVAYTSNGGIIGMTKRSSVSGQEPDLFIFALAGNFRGYEPGYSKQTVELNPRTVSWLVLKAHTRNRAGYVRLRSTDPRDTPIINFNNFAEGGEEDLRAMVDGVNTVRSIVDDTHSKLRTLNFFRAFGRARRVVETYPGRTETNVADFVVNNAWGHHASCTAPIGRADDPNAVLDSDFRVRGTVGLRVVDASVFPEIPGYFVVVPTYMVSEKASDVILRDNL